MADDKNKGTENQGGNGGAEGGGGTDGGNGNGTPADEQDTRAQAKGLIKEALKEFAEENKPTSDSRHGNKTTVGDWFNAILGL